MTSDAGDRDELDLAARILERVVAGSPGADVEVSVDRDRVGLTRFANSFIHQNVAEDTLRVGLRVHAGGRTVTCASTVVGEDGVGALVTRALDAAAIAPRDPGWPGVAPPAPVPAVPTIDAATRDATPDDRARRVRDFVAAGAGLETAGYCRTDHWRGAFVNSADHRAAGERADVGLAGIVRHNGADGVARVAGGRLADVDGARLGARAAAKARAGTDPDELAPGHYEVVLEPTAVVDILESLAMWAFNAKAVAERRSVLRIGEAQFDPSVRLADDAPAAGVPYDAEGTPTARVVLVDSGTTAAVTHDRRTAAVAGTVSTGNSIGSPSFGSIARHLVLSPPAGGEGAASEVDGPVNDSSTAELVAGVERGVLVTDFWYTRVLDPRTLAVTGLTRNGVWAIERGEVTRPLRNFRFTQAYAGALMPGAVLGVGRTASVVPGDAYAASMPWWTAPALRLATWHFTGGASG